ncbi:hypothetical protein [Marinimicrobium sp. ABcell2]|uniref:hypothetical protein n=1 Tax=Marinimicrobium sp. ABcell2 TaxID=3069751 RepID=UPI0027AE7F95|nr:hypothetical protein [Marinimicrobium sp. ABcell2]MDQ2077410.1 hypothetical protein [Marinimicrobium sp. ABcell2]
MDVSRIAHGVYLAVHPTTMNERLLGGKLSTVYATMKEEGISEYRLFYLVETEAGSPEWEPVDLKHHRHYHGEQRKRILHWFHVCNAQLSLNGMHFMAKVLGVNPNRLRNALRPPDTAHYQPFSSEAMVYLKYRFDQSSKNRSSSAA